jgi:hypothetical protein
MKGIGASKFLNPVLLVDSYAGGISIGRAVSLDAEHFDLSLDGGRKNRVPLRSRYVATNGAPLDDLARHLERLSARGELRRATVVFGVCSDPFHPFDEKFAVSLKFMEMFERYVPGRLVIQTRSPLVLLALPLLKKLRGVTYVAIGIETPHDDIRRRYTPTLPAVEERFKTVRALRSFNVKVGVQVAPLLPYGDWRKDAGSFAQELVAVSDFITVRSVVQTEGAGRPTSALAQHLAQARDFFWLRHDAHVPLLSALEDAAVDRLFHPASLPYEDPQMELFG